MDFATTDIWIIWGMIAVICFILEIFVPSFWMAILGVGAIGTSIASFFGAGIEIQIAVFSILSVGTGVFFRPLALKYFHRNTEEKSTNVDAMIGRKVQVIVEITPQKNGKVKIGSEVWTALAKESSESFADGDFVVISSIDGAKVIVESGDFQD
ncbi:MAG: NfeD family protein [bacterium]